MIDPRALILIVPPGIVLLIVIYFHLKDTGFYLF